MGLDFFRRTLELERRYAAPGQRILNTMQTNATLLDDEWCAFLKENDFLVGVSIDGPREMHDAYRVDKGGKPTFDRVIRGLDALKRHGVEWNALTTVNAANGDHGLEVYRFLRDELGASFVQLIPIVERVTRRAAAAGRVGLGRARRRPAAVPAGGRPRHPPHGRRRGSTAGSSIDVFEEWARHDVGDVFVSMFDTALAHWMGMDQAGLCVHARTCGDAVALEHNGDLYSCDHYVEPGYLLGNIAEGRTMLELVNLPQQRAFGQAKLDTLPAVLPRVRRAVRLQRRLPQGPVHHHPRRRARAALPLRRLPGLLPPRRRPDAGHGRPAAPGPRRHRRCATGTPRATRNATRPTRAPARAGRPGPAATGPRLAHPCRNAHRLRADPVRATWR